MAPRRQRLAQRRKAVGFTQEVFAEQLDVERSTVVRWEAGDTEPSPWRRPKIARLLQVSLNHLEGLLEQTSEPTHIDESHVLPNAAPLAAVNADASAIHGFRAADKQVGGGHLYATVVSYLHTEVGPRLFGGSSLYQVGLVIKWVWSRRGVLTKGVTFRWLRDCP